MSTVTGPGCVVFLMDESSGMKALMEEMTAGGKSQLTNADRTATALNSLLKRLGGGPDFDVALVGYQADATGEVNVGSRWGGPLAGRDFVRVSELAAAPLRVETRTRKLRSSSGAGPAEEESFEFPVWYSPELGAKAPQVAAFQYVADLLERWVAGASPDAAAPLVVHVLSGVSADGNPHRAALRILEMQTPGGKPLLFHAHLAARAEAISFLYPANVAYLTVPAACDWFRRASVVPAPLVASLKEVQVSLRPGARALLYNAKIADLIRMLGLVKAYTKDWRSAAVAPVPAPEPVPEPTPVSIAESAPDADEVFPPESPETVDSDASSPGDLYQGDLYQGDAAPGDEASTAEPVALAPAEKVALVVLVLDRSIEDPSVSAPRNPCAKLQDHANDLLKKISAFTGGDVDVALVSYGLDSTGQIDLCTTFQLLLEGQTIVRHSDLPQGALRVEEFPEEVSDGAGGLITVTQKKPIFVEWEPTAAASPAPAFQAVRDIVGEWALQHSNPCLMPIVLHLTRGRFDPWEIEQAVELLRSVPLSPVTLYHLVATESPYKSLAYPATADEIDDEALRKLWELSSALLGRERLSVERRTIPAEARGMVINGKFDLLLEGVKDALTA